MSGFELRVDGTPIGWQRARIDTRGRRPRHYNDHKTRLGESRVRVAWIDAGSPTVGDGPIAVEVEVVLERPNSHYRVDGSLGAAGERNPWPARKPDVDNVVKLVLDALNTTRTRQGAYRDDAQVVHAWVVKRWANPGEGEHTRVVVRAMPPLAAPRGKVAA